MLCVGSALYCSVESPYCFRIFPFAIFLLYSSSLLISRIKHLVFKEVCRVVCSPSYFKFSLLLRKWLCNLYGNWLWELFVRMMMKYYTSIIAVLISCLYLHLLTSPMTRATYFEPMKSWRVVLYANLILILSSKMTQKFKDASRKQKIIIGVGTAELQIFWNKFECSSIEKVL